MGEYEKALVYYQKSLTIAERTNGNQEQIVRKLNNITGIYSKLEQYDKALDLNQRAMTLSKSIDFKSGIAMSNYMRGFILEDKGDYDKAIDNFRKNYVINKSIGRQLRMISPLTHIGEIYNKQKKYQQAIDECKKGYAISQEMESKNVELSLCRCLYEGYKGQGNWKKALEFNEKITLIKDNQRQAENIAAINQQEYKYQYEKEKAISELEYQTSLRYRNLGLLFMLGLLLGMISFAVSQYRARKEKQKLLDELELKNKEVTRVNQEIIVTQDQLIVQEKLASLGQLTASIGHEIKNPLNFITNFAEGSKELIDEISTEIGFVNNDLPNDKSGQLTSIIHELKLNTNDIYDNSLRVDKIVSSMMNHARNTSGKATMENINDLISTNIDFAYTGWKSTHSNFKVDIIQNLNSQVESVLVYPQEFGRVILNLIENACFAIHQKLMQPSNDYHPTITVTSALENEKLLIRVKDNGIGIPSEIQPDIFNPFFTTKPTGSGNTGLGLSICYDIIVKLHKGKVKVESQLGEFTEFVITIPTNKPL